MAVFYDTGGGDIYAGPTREAVLAAMKADSDDTDESAIKELDGDTLTGVTNENEEHTGEFMTLAEVYGNSTDALCIASTNC